MNIAQDIQAAINQSLNTLNIETDEILVEPTSNVTFGDLSTNVAMKLFPNVDKAKWNSPRSFAEAIVSQLSKLPIAESQLSKISVAGAGFINFTISQEYFTQTVLEIASQEPSVSSNQNGKVALVEYSSPNIAKPFTIGHLRSTIIGDAIANLLEATGYEVKRDNHLGDWGTQFGKLIVAIQELGEGSEKANIEKISNASEPVKELVKLYVEFHTKAETDPTLEDKAREWFTKLEHGEESATRLWKLCIDWSWKEFSRLYDELGIKFTENDGRGYGESFFEDKMDQVIKALEASGYLQTGDEGAKLFFFPNEEYPPLMILKKDGSTLYATRDLATDLFRLEKYGRDILVINEVGAEQELYFKQIFRIEELLGWYKAGSRVHIKHGFYRLQGGKMSTRKGNTILLEDVIEEAKKRALALSKSHDSISASKIAIGSLKWNDLKRSSNLEITFDWDEILSMEGNSGAYMQYTAVRTGSVLRKSTDEKNRPEPDTKNDWNLNDKERAVAAVLVQFELALKRAASEYAPQHLCTYLYLLAGTYNSFYTSNRILGESEHETKRLALTQATQKILQKGLQILGVPIPDSM